MMIAEEIARRLLQINAIKLSPQSPFTWASGIQSPIYCDNRIVLSFPEIRNFVKQSFVQAAKAYPEVNTIAGVATAGIPHGMMLADALNLPFIYVRSKAKAHGRQNLIEGQLNPGAKVLVVEDLISTGGSCLKAVEALRAEGAEVLGVLAIFSYGFDRAKAAFEAANCPYETLSNYEVLIEEAVKSGYVVTDDLQLLKDWRSKVGTTS